LSVAPPAQAASQQAIMVAARPALPGMPRLIQLGQ